MKATAALLLAIVFSFIASTGGQARFAGRDHPVALKSGVDIHSLQWDHRAIHLAQAWQNVPTKGSKTNVCVADSGAPGPLVTDLSGSVVAKVNTSDPLNPTHARDDFGHGTFVSSEIAAHGVFVGVAPNTHLLEAKIGGDMGISPYDASAGLFWCVMQGADVISLSWGGPNFDHNAIKPALHYACQHDISIAVAAGNDSITAPGSQPADFKHNRCLIAVNSLDRNGWISSYSNILQNPRSISAPGGNVLGLVPSGGIGDASGTSMSAPLVAGVLALLHDEGYSAQNAIKRLMATASPPPPMSFRKKDYLGPSRITGAYGAGVLNAAAATAQS